MNVAIYMQLIKWYDQLLLFPEAAGLHVTE